MDRAGVASPSRSSGGSRRWPIRASSACATSVGSTTGVSTWSPIASSAPASRGSPPSRTRRNGARCSCAPRWISRRRSPTCTRAASSTATSVPPTCGCRRSTGARPARSSSTSGWRAPRTPAMAPRAARSATRRRRRSPARAAPPLISSGSAPRCSRPGAARRRSGAVCARRSGSLGARRRRCRRCGPGSARRGTVSSIACSRPIPSIARPTRAWSCAR